MDKFWKSWYSFKNFLFRLFYLILLSLNWCIQNDQFVNSSKNKWINVSLNNFLFINCFIITNNSILFSYTVLKFNATYKSLSLFFFKLSNQFIYPVLVAKKKHKDTVSTREIRFFKKEKSTALTRYPQSCGFIEVSQAETQFSCFFQNACQFSGSVDRINFSIPFSKE